MASRRRPSTTLILRVESCVWVGQATRLAVNNPAAEAKIEGRGKKITREKYFTEQEIAAILRAAHAVQGTPRENPKTTAAKRWVPWLCAYSGARVAEMIQLRKQDVRKDQAGWVIRFTPEAGGIKNNAFRDVPVHQHLIALGFLDLVERANDGPLFCEIGKDGTTTGPAEGVYKRILEAFAPSFLTQSSTQPCVALYVQDLRLRSGFGSSDARCDLRPCREDQGQRLHQGHPQEADGGYGLIPAIEAQRHNAVGSSVETEQLHSQDREKNLPSRSASVPYGRWPRL